MLFFKKGDNKIWSYFYFYKNNAIPYAKTKVFSNKQKLDDISKLLFEQSYGLLYNKVTFWKIKKLTLYAFSKFNKKLILDTISKLLYKVTLPTSGTSIHQEKMPYPRPAAPWPKQKLSNTIYCTYTHSAEYYLPSIYT